MGFRQSEAKQLMNQYWPITKWTLHYNDVIMGKIASQITSLTIVYSSVYSGADERKHPSSASLAFVWGIHRWPVIYPHKGQVTRKMFPFDDVIMGTIKSSSVKFEWKYTKMVLWETAFENIICKLVAILLGPQCAKRTYVIPKQTPDTTN